MSNVYHFEEGGETYDVVAESALAAFHYLVEQDCFSEAFRHKEDDDGDFYISVSWHRRKDDEPLTIWMYDCDPETEDLAQPDVKWDADKRSLSMSAKSWAKANESPSLIATTAY